MNRKLILCMVFIIQGSVESAFLDVLPSDIDGLISKAEQACIIQSQYADKFHMLEALNKSLDLIDSIYHKTCGIVGQQCLVVRQLSELKKQFKHEIAKMRKEKNPQSIQVIFNNICKPDGVSHKAFKQAVIVGHEAKKWLTKSHARLRSQDKAQTTVKIANNN